jgi:hypothetical protein
MLRLTIDKTRRWITLACGAELEIQPVTALIMAAARSGKAWTALPTDASAEMRYVVLVAEVAKLVVVDWRGVGDDDGNTLPVSPEAVQALMDHTLVNRDFAGQVIGPHLLMAEEKKDWAPLPNGTLAGAPDIAETAAPLAPSAPTH